MTEEDEPAEPPAPGGPGVGLNVEATAVWETVVEDMEATAAELSEAGWEPLELHPGDVNVPTEAAEPGIDVVLPNPEFDTLSTIVSLGVHFTEYEVYRADGEGLTYALVVAKAPEKEIAVLIPLYYRVQDLVAILEDRETLPIFLRTLGDETVELDLADPSLLFPDEG